MERLQELKAAVFGAHEVRKTWAQKTAFIEWAKGYAREQGVELTIEESGRAMRSRNLVFGAPDLASTIVTAHYDTCARLPFPNFLTPQCWPMILLTQVVPWVLIFGAVGAFCGYTTGRMLRDASLLSALLPSLVYVAVAFGAIALMLFGPANPHTANDNTSGVILLLLAMEALRGRDDVAFVLFDNEEKGLVGSQAFAKRHPRAVSRAFAVNLDCVSDGETLLYTGSKAGMRCAQAEKLLATLKARAPLHGRKVASGSFPGTLYPSDQLVFAKGTAFVALKGGRVLYIDRIHTAKDTVFDDGNLDCLLEVLREGI